MAYRIRLSDEDRERIGCDEWLELDLSHLPVEEAEAIEDATGKTWDMVLDPGAKAAKARLWFALRRAGIEVSFAELTFNLLGMRVTRDEDDPGKADSSDNDEPSTPQTSASSSPD